MKVRRCAVVFLEPRESIQFDLMGLMTGGGGARSSVQWLAQAPHLDAPVAIEEDARECLGRLSPELWVSAEALSGWPAGVLDHLLEHGLALADDGDGDGDGGRWRTHVEQDAKVRSGNWWGAAAMMHRASRWEGQDAAAATEAAGLSTVAGLRATLGPPPPAVIERCPSRDRLVLPKQEDADFEALLKRRTTCRNFDAARELPQASLSRMMQRVFAAHASWRMEDDTVFLKKGSPSGGGLHPIEAYLLVQRVEGVAPGLYHYHPIAHALEPLSRQVTPLPELARLMVAGQEWFADAHVIVVMAARFPRCFWKYRRHAKAYRAVTMDAGHLSQTLYLSATELGLGAFVTCAINEVDIERAFGLDPLDEGVMAVCGFGWRAEWMGTAEFDPAGRVWPVGA